ncbi:DUF1801 domain-containing protein [Abyssibius alkaniclasticus]|uniref:hypothetical protein n=1 Tax=Abyssibius alkaniclasticus TaxID=2881234 RepID=UPI0023644FDD|nr:hypothetical protein [Abyssibius alkaniclasticus]UPH71592.1 DUF1801 domain-containing protein [Abyssibius alkaniclasticus]
MPAPAIQAAYDALPPEGQTRALALRALVLETAQAMPELGGLDECLKWGQPAYLPRKPRIGTTLRIGASPSHALLYVPCTTTLVTVWREVFSGVEFIDNRAAGFAHAAALPKAIIARMVLDALRYHLDRRAK